VSRTEQAVREEARAEKDNVSPGVLALELKAMRSEFRLWLMGAVVANQALAHIELPTSVGFVGGAAVVGGILFKTFILRA